MRYSLPCLPHKLIVRFNKLTGGSTSERADVTLNEPSPPSPSPHPPAIPSFPSSPFSSPLPIFPSFFPLIYEQLQREMFCLGSMNIDDGVVLV